jgi:hypothetical protein
MIIGGEKNGGLYSSVKIVGPSIRSLVSAFATTWILGILGFITMPNDPYTIGFNEAREKKETPPRIHG